MTSTTGVPIVSTDVAQTESLDSEDAGAPNESVRHIICSPKESCWLAKIQVFRLAGCEILLLIEVLPGNY